MPEAVGGLLEVAGQGVGQLRLGEEDEAVDLAGLMPNRHQPDVAHAAVGIDAVGPGRRVHAVDVDGLGIGQAQARRPFAGEIIDHAAAGAAGRAAEQDRRTVLALGDHGIGRIDHVEAGRHLEGEPERRVQEATVADEALLRLIAIHHAVDLRQKEVTLHDRAADLGAAGFLDRALDAVGRTRMRRHHAVLVFHVGSPREHRIERVTAGRNLHIAVNVHTDGTRL